MKTQSEFDGYLFWHILNTCLILLLAVWIGTSLSIPTQCEQRVTDMERKLELYENMKPDSVIIRINNNIDVPIPKVIKITK